MQLFVLADILLASPDDFVGVCCQRSERLAANGAQHHISVAEGLCARRLEVLHAVDFALLVQWKVDYGVEYANNGGGKSSVEREDAFVLFDSVHGSEHVGRVLAVVGFVAKRAEDLSLHARAHYPKRVGDHVAGNACDARRRRVEPELVFLPALIRLQAAFYFLVQREINGVKQRRAERADCVAPEQSFKPFYFDGLVERAQAVRLDSSASLLL